MLGFTDEARAVAEHANAKEATPHQEHAQSTIMNMVMNGEDTHRIAHT